MLLLNATKAHSVEKNAFKKSLIIRLKYLYMLSGNKDGLLPDVNHIKLTRFEQDPKRTLHPSFLELVNVALMQRFEIRLFSRSRFNLGLIGA